MTSWLRVFYCWYGFFHGLALLYEPSGVGDGMGLYALIGQLPVYTYSTQYWYATKYTHNYACSRTVYALHFRVITVVGKYYWFLDEK